MANQRWRPTCRTRPGCLPSTRQAKFRLEIENSICEALMEFHHDRQIQTRVRRQTVTRSGKSAQKEGKAPCIIHALAIPFSVTSVDVPFEPSEPSHASNHLSTNLNPWTALVGCYVTRPFGPSFIQAFRALHSMDRGQIGTCRACLSHAHPFVAFRWRSDERWCSSLCQRSSSLCRQTKRHARMES
jgi:hypothetical protein